MTAKERTAERNAKVAEFKVKLATSHRWAIRAIEVLYEYQTPDEKQGMHTDELNGVGFSQFDSEILSSFAEQLKAGRQLSFRQIEVAQKLMPKYAGQLVRIVEANGAVA